MRRNALIIIFIAAAFCGSLVSTTNGDSAAGSRELWRYPLVIGGKDQQMTNHMEALVPAQLSRRRLFARTAGGIGAGIIGYIFGKCGLDRAAAIAADVAEGGTFRPSIFSVQVGRPGRSVSIGYLVTTWRSRRLPGIILAQPRPIGFAVGDGPQSLASAKAFAQRDAEGIDFPLLTADQIEAIGVMARILYPVDDDGRRVLDAWGCPAAMFYRPAIARASGMIYKPIDAWRLEKLKQNSGTPETSNAANLGGQSSERKRITTAA